MLKTDMFLKKTAKDRLWEWLKEKKHAKTSEIIEWGVRNYSNRADRNARQLAKEMKIRRMPEAKKLAIYGDINEEVWEVINWFNMKWSNRKW